MAYLDLFNMKMSIVKYLRDSLYPRQRHGNSFYNNSIDASYAQSFIPFSTSMNSISLYLDKEGSPPNDLTVSLVTDLDNTPSSDTIKTISYSPSTITAPDWYDRPFPYNNLISKNTYWIVINSAGQNSTNYYKIGCNSVRTDYQEGVPKMSTNSTWDSIDYDIKFDITTPDWIYPTYPADTVSIIDLPRIVVDIIDRRIEERYCSDKLALGNITGVVLVYSQYPDELDQILSYGERGLFKKRTSISEVRLLTPGAISPIDRIRERMYVRTFNFNLRKKFKYLETELPTIEILKIGEGKIGIDKLGEVGVEA